ncbi:imidazole glycerol phosphate synthase subunit HisH, partial [Salmonella enterica subsp. enterica serovar Infantis]
MHVVLRATGCAKVSSVTSAVARPGSTPVVGRDAELGFRADKLVLRGVGTAQAARDQLRDR